MSGIKSLADELREAIRHPPADSGKPAVKERPPPAAAGEKRQEATRGQTADEPADLRVLFASIQSHKPGPEKLLIRLAPNTVKLLKQLKIMQAIDVNKFISFALHEYLRGNPALISYIKESLKHVDL